VKLRVIDEETGAGVDEAYEVRLPGWSEERFLDEAPEQGFHELKDGELIVHAPANLDHQRVVRFLTFLLEGIVSKASLGEVFNGPGVFRVREGLLREPDVFFVSNERLSSARDRYAGAADFVIEVLSESGRRRDLVEKAEEYASAGVGEYWVVDPAGREVAVHRLEAPPAECPEARYAADTFREGRLESTAVPGFRIEVGWLWRRPLPSDYDCLREIAG
jgi:Uma2 family endonuclease